MMMASGTKWIVLLPRSDPPVVLQVSERNKSSREDVVPRNLGGHIEEVVDEPILTLDVMPAQPSHLTLPNYVHRLIALNRSFRSLEFTEPLLSAHTPFDRAMVLLDDVIQILDGSVAAPAAERPFLLYVCDGRAVNRRQIRVDDAGLRMRLIAQRAAKQPFGGIGVAQCRQ